MRKTLDEEVAEVVARHAGECDNKSRLVMALVHTLLAVERGEKLSEAVAEYAFAARYLPPERIGPEHAVVLRARQEADEDD